MLHCHTNDLAESAADAADHAERESLLAGVDPDIASQIWHEVYDEYFRGVYSEDF